VPTPAEADGSAAAQIESVAFRIADCEFPFHSERTILLDRDLCHLLILQFDFQLNARSFPAALKVFKKENNLIRPLTHKRAKPHEPACLIQGRAVCLLCALCDPRRFA
jgi:hypothetical protein